MKSKITDLYNFLNQNSKWNADLQFREYRRSLYHCDDEQSRLKALLHSTVNSQSKPNLNKLSEFWYRFENYQWDQGKPTLDELILNLRGDFSGSGARADTGAWEQLFESLKAQPGWGDKTAALFVKNTIKIHRSGESRLQFLQGIDRYIKSIDGGQDKIYLPVDAVIIHIFNKHILPDSNNNFSSINNFLLAKNYLPYQILEWDDLWYWGYLTQNSEDRTRVTAWNAVRFWTLQFSPKSDVKVVERLANKFIEILRS